MKTVYANTIDGPVPGATEYFERKFFQEKEQCYLYRHFNGFRGRIALWFLGKRRAENLMYDCAQQGWGYKSNYDWLVKNK